MWTETARKKEWEFISGCKNRSGLPNLSAFTKSLPPLWLAWCASFGEAQCCPNHGTALLGWIWIGTWKSENVPYHNCGCGVRLNIAGIGQGRDMPVCKYKRTSPQTRPFSSFKRSEWTFGLLGRGSPGTLELNCLKAPANELFSSPQFFDPLFILCYVVILCLYMLFFWITLPAAKSGL